MMIGLLCLAVTAWTAHHSSAPRLPSPNDHGMSASLPPGAFPSLPSSSPSSSAPSPAASNPQQSQSAVAVSPSPSARASSPPAVRRTQPPPLPKVKSYKARGTGYYPHNDAMEGGFYDRKGNPLHTLQSYLAGNAPFVSVAMDPNAFPYGQKLRIPQMEKRYGRKIIFKVVDTGGAFYGTFHPDGVSRIDICTGSLQDTYDATINGPLTLIPVN